MIWQRLATFRANCHNLEFSLPWTDQNTPDDHGIPYTHASPGIHTSSCTSSIPFRRAFHELLFSGFFPGADKHGSGAANQMLKAKLKEQ